jgi:hypothetical protein
MFFSLSLKRSEVMRKPLRTKKMSTPRKPLENAWLIQGKGVTSKKRGSVLTTV